MFHDDDDDGDDDDDDDGEDSDHDSWLMIIMIHDVDNDDGDDDDDDGDDNDHDSWFMIHDDDDDEFRVIRGYILKLQASTCRTYKRDIVLCARNQCTSQNRILNQQLG